MLRIVLHHCLTNGGLIIFLVAYTCMGAAVFQRLEAPLEKSKFLKLVMDRQTNRSEFLNNIKSQLPLAFSDEATWREMTSDYLERYEHALGVIVVEKEENPLSSWNFYGSMFFATTVLTTIGYGNIAPVTVGGRVFCMVYAVFGIALLLLVLASIGTLLARGATLGYRRILRWIKKKRSKDETDVVTFQRDPRAQEVIDEGWKGDDGDSHKVDIQGKNGESAGAVEKGDSATVEGEEEKPPEAEAQIPLTFILVFAFLYICFLACLLQAWEDQWSYFEAFYFSFITLTTIGFGDLVPHHQKNLLACTFFILLGMAIMSMCIALAQEMIIQKVAWLSKKIGVAFASHKQRKGDDSS
nr:TWiK family of potassium channels protein 7-like [Lytechinus pictus]